MLTKTPIDLRNFVLLAEPGGEKRACEYLKNEDGDFGPHSFDPYVPWEKKTVTYSVRTMFGAHRRTREDTRAIFPGYVFLPLNLPWEFGPIDKCPGLRKDGGRYLRKPDKEYRTLDESDMAMLRLAECVVNEESPFEIGDQVRILDGPFADHVAEISQMDDLQRIELLMDFLGRKSKMVASISQIAAV